MEGIDSDRLLDCYNKSHTDYKGVIQMSEQNAPDTPVLGHLFQGGKSRKQTFLGQPLEAHGKTLIPVTRAQGWFSRPGRKARPLGFLEISDAQTRFIRLKDKRWLWLGLGLALLAGLIAVASIGLSKNQRPRRRPSLW